ncbi:MAG: hypothetical protein VYA08_11935 [Pseudomonadota bacterium]|nr:hypothetical protein [Pseudomonadota bacterium]
MKKITYRAAFSALLLSMAFSTGCGTTPEIATVEPTPALMEMCGLQDTDPLMYKSGKKMILNLNYTSGPSSMEVITFGREVHSGLDVGFNSEAPKLRVGIGNNEHCTLKLTGGVQYLRQSDQTTTSKLVVNDGIRSQELEGPYSDWALADRKKRMTGFVINNGKIAYFYYQPAAIISFEVIDNGYSPEEVTAIDAVVNRYIEERVAQIKRNIETAEKRAEEERRVEQLFDKARIAPKNVGDQICSADNRFGFVDAVASHGKSIKIQLVGHANLFNDHFFFRNSKRQFSYQAIQAQPQWDHSENWGSCYFDKAL